MDIIIKITRLLELFLHRPFVPFVPDRLFSVSN